MSSICLPREGSRREEKRKPVSAFHSGLALAVLWVVNILIILFGWPFLLYGKIKYRREQPESRTI